MNKNKSQKETDPKLLEDSVQSKEENPSVEEEGGVPAYLPAEDVSVPDKGKNKMKDYILELEFTPEAETINIDAMQNSEDAEPLQAPLVSPLPKPMNPPNLSESKERSKIEQLEAAIEKIKKTKLRELSMPALDDGSEIMVGVSGALSPDQISEIAPIGAKAKPPQPIFITYGYNEAMRDEVVATLQKLDFPVIVRENTAVEGKTFTTNFIEFHDIGFAVVVLSGDDFGHPKDQEAHQAKLRPRQQIVFELGFLTGKLGRDRVFVLHQDSKNFELPTAFLDILYIPYRKMGEWQLELVRQLKRAGYPVDANKLI